MKSATKLSLSHKHDLSNNNCSDGENVHADRSKPYFQTHVQLDLPRCFVSVHHNFETDRKLDISPSLINHFYGNNNPKILAPIPQFAEIVSN